MDNDSKAVASNAEISDDTADNQQDDSDIFAHINDHVSEETVQPDQSSGTPATEGNTTADVTVDVPVETAETDIISAPLLSPAKAVLSTQEERNEQDEMFHEEEISRVLTTLESAKKDTQKKAAVEEIEEEIEVYTEVLVEDNELHKTDGDTTKDETETETTDPGEMARRQLEKIQNNQRPRSQKPNGGTASPVSSDLIQNMKKQLAQKIVTPNKQQTKQTASAGIIEIPKELISGSEELNSSIIVNAETPLKRADLLAILEGSDEDAQSINKSGLTDKEYEKQLALKQIMSLPPKPKGRRPRPKPEVITKPVKPKSDLVSSLVQDWSGGSESDSKTEDELKKPAMKQKVLKKKSPVPKVPSEEEPPMAFKRSRIIKKKIIWDPDAPETAISYASLIQPSAAFIKKTHGSAVPNKKVETAPRILNKIPMKQGQEENDKADVIQGKRRVVSTPSPTTSKKRKVSEIDKLLGDEGAANMLNALKQSSSNTDLSEQESSPETGKTNSRMNSSQDSITEDVARVGRNKRAQTPQKQAQQSVVAKKEPAKRKRTPNAGSKSWDYIYSNRDDDSLIIRRRSNSSYSSSASNNRLSIDTPASTQSAKSTKGSTKPGRKPRNKESTSFEFAKPNARKSAQSSETGESTILLDIRPKTPRLSSPTSVGSARRRSTVNHSPEESSKEKKILNKSEANHTTVAKQRVSSKSIKPMYHEIRMERDGNVAHIILEPFSDKLENVFTIQVMREICKALLMLDDDTTCKVVLISSATATFCNGLDYSSLVHSSLEKRKAAAAELSSEVGKFIESLASFRKTLIAGVHGHIVGLGVTILPLFDLVLANANSTFETPYARIGQVPEGCSVLVLSNKVNQNAKSELLLLGETLDAASAHGHSLVTKVIHTNGFEAELQRQVSLVAQLSVQALEAAKAVIHAAELAALPVRLADELKVLQQHWMSTECQYNIKQYLLTHKW